MAILWASHNFKIKSGWPRSLTQIAHGLLTAPELSVDPKASAILKQSLKHLHHAAAEP